jgi:hypothetical protein
MLDLAMLLASISHETLDKIGQIEFNMGTNGVDIECPDQEILHLILNVWHEMWTVSTPPLVIHHSIKEGSLNHLVTEKAMQNLKKTQTARRSILIAPLKKPISYDN